MGAFGIYVIILTFGYIVYYCAVIMMDLRSSKVNQKDDVEVFDLGGFEDDDQSRNVTEKEGGGFDFVDGVQQDDENKNVDGSETDVDNGDLGLGGTSTSSPEVHGVTVTIGGSENKESDDNPIPEDVPESNEDDADDEEDFMHYNDDVPVGDATAESNGEDSQDDSDGTTSNHQIVQDLLNLRDNKMQDVLPEYEGELDALTLFAEMFNPIEPHKIKMYPVE